MNSRQMLISVLTILVLVFIITPAYYIIVEGHLSSDQFRNTFWALVPAVIAIALALITKEVYCSLFIGIFAGAFLWAGFNVRDGFDRLVSGGFIQSLDAYNIGILMFLVMLGTLVALMNKAGGSRAFADWAAVRIKTRIGAQISAAILGILVFVDDYFNCLTVGSVMRPITDSHKISRAKLAYIIDSTSAPVCIIAPVSSWAAAVTGFVPGSDGFLIFLKTIPYNFYVFLAIFMVFLVILMKVDFGPMKYQERMARLGEVTVGNVTPSSDECASDHREGATIYDLFLPIIVLIISCIFFMMYIGGIFDGATVIEAFSNCDSFVALSMGSLVAGIIAIVYYVGRKTISFSECLECVPAGFKAMVPAILILVFAWTLKIISSSLGSEVFVQSILQDAGSLLNFMPAVFFLIAALIAFSTGTSWGTFGIFIPITVASFHSIDDQLMVIAIAASMAGAVCGDHCSPISDTSILSSAGAQCNLLTHITTQMPYVIVVALISFVSFVLVGFVRSALICLPLSLILLFVVVRMIKRIEPERVREMP